MASMSGSSSQPLTSLTKFPSAKPLPQIICLHGRGSNARILQFQMRLVTARLANKFEFLFINGPFISDPGPGILPWFEGMDPYFHWGSASIGASSSIPSSSGLSVSGQKQVDDAEEREMKVLNGILDELLEGKDASRVVGVLGFSQGTRVASGLLKRQEILTDLQASNEEKSGIELNGENERSVLSFGVFVCGGGGLSFRPFNLVPPETISWQTSLELLASEKTNGGSYVAKDKIHLPTLHVHGESDTIAEKGKEMVEAWFDEKSARVLDVDAGHHFPREKNDVAEICRNILQMWEPSRLSWEAAHEI